MERTKKSGNNLIDLYQKGKEKEKFIINTSGNLFFSSDKILFSDSFEENNENILRIEKNEKNKGYYIDCVNFIKKCLTCL